MIDAYTKLLEVAAESEDKAVADAAVEKLIAHLKSTGRMKMLGGIARELYKVDARRKALAPVVEVAHASEGGTALAAAAEAGITAKHAVVNHALIRGWRARGHGLLVDRSAKSALEDIYKKVTA